MDNRPNLDVYYMRQAQLVSTRSTCVRRAVGCCLVDGHGRLLSTGYNGVPRGELHCNDLVRAGAGYVDIGNAVQAPTRIVDTYPHACPGAFSRSGGTGPGCLAVHAEQNAVLQCREPDRVAIIYVTLSPCDACLKLLANIGEPGAVQLVVGEWHDEAMARSRWRGPITCIGVM